MTRRRLGLGLLAALIVLGGWFYWFYFKSPEAAIRHAESFLFRRMAVSQVDAEGTYRHFFVTNRALEAGSAPVEDRFTREHSSQLSFGTFDAQLRPTLGLGMLLDATDWFQNEEIRISDISRLDKAEILQALEDVVAGLPAGVELRELGGEGVVLSGQGRSVGHPIRAKNASIATPMQISGTMIGSATVPSYAALPGNRKRHLKASSRPPSARP